MAAAGVREPRAGRLGKTADVQPVLGNVDADAHTHVSVSTWSCHTSLALGYPFRSVIGRRRPDCPRASRPRQATVRPPPLPVLVTPATAPYPSGAGKTIRQGRRGRICLRQIRQVNAARLRVMPGNGRKGSTVSRYHSFTCSFQQVERFAGRRTSTKNAKGIAAGSFGSRSRSGFRARPGPRGARSPPLRRGCGRGAWRGWRRRGTWLCAPRCRGRGRSPCSGRRRPSAPAPRARAG